MSTDIFKPIYKTRNYIEVVKISEERDVEYFKDVLTDALPENKDIIEKYKKIYDSLVEQRKALIKSVGSFVEKTNATLKDYKAIDSGLLANVWKWPQKFQEARKKYKDELKKAENDLDSLTTGKQVTTGGPASGESMDDIKERIKLIESSLTGLKLMSSEMKSVLSSEFGLMTEKTVNNAISSFAVIYNRILNKITKKQSKNFRDRLREMVADAAAHMYSDTSLKERIQGDNSKNDLGYWVNKISGVGQKNDSIENKLNEDKVREFEKKVDDVVDKLRTKQKALLSELQGDPALTGREARRRMETFLADAKGDLEFLRKDAGVPDWMLHAARLKICGSLLSESCDSQDVWAVFGMGSKGALSASEKLKVTADNLDRGTALATACSGLGVLYCGGLIGMCMSSTPVGQLTKVLSGFSVSISSLISIGLGKVTGDGIRNVRKYIKKRTRDKAKKVFNTDIIDENG